MHGSLGRLESYLGRYDQARTDFTEALVLYKAIDDRMGEANLLLDLGHLEHKVNRHDKARMNFHQAAHVYEALGMKDLQKRALDLAEAK